MQLYEHHTKDILERYGVPLPRRRLVMLPEEASAALGEVGPGVVIKAQVPAGGRGKAGGIRFADDQQTVIQTAAALLGTAIRGFSVRRLLVEERLEIVAEYYLGFTVDPRARRAVCMVSAAGGVEVESDHAALRRVAIDPYLGLQPYQVVDLATAAGVDRRALPQFVAVAQKLYRAFVEYGALLLEINPVALTADGQLVAADARMNLDDHALHRQDEIRQLVESNPNDFPSEYRKLKESFDYLRLHDDGQVGMISSGAGLTMATIDQIHACGLRVYNFADLRTGQLNGDPHRLLLVFAELARASQLRVIMVHVFAGTTDLAEFARTLLRAVEAFGRPLPSFVVRCVGTNEDEGIRLLRDAGFYVTRDLDEAVAAVVRIGGGGRVHSAE